jgi:hypothetical protein
VQRKRPRSFLNVAFIYAGNDLLSHTLGACSTIGPAGLNLRRLAGVNEPPIGGDWEPAAEVLSVPCEGSHPYRLPKEKADHVSMIGLYLCRQRPTLPHTWRVQYHRPCGA